MASQFRAEVLDGITIRPYYICLYINKYIYIYVYVYYIRASIVVTFASVSSNGIRMEEKYSNIIFLWGMEGRRLNY